MVAIPKVLVLFTALIVLCPAVSSAKEKCKVMVVMSYEKDFPWVQQQKEGIDSVLAERCEVSFVYLDTKRNFGQGAEKARKAFELFKSLQPQGVIAADDDAQSMFVVPYLKDKVSVPVMFCGVNASPEKYGYPAGNVSGILERHHIAESIVLARQLIPTIKTIGFMMKESPVAGFVREQVDLEASSYGIEISGFNTPSTLAEAIAAAKDLHKRVDVLWMETLEGIPDEQGVPVKDRVAMPTVAKAFGKGTLTGNPYYVEYGLLMAVVLSGQEQGATAARMLLQAIEGAPVDTMPLARNYNGKRMLNVSTMRELKIHPKPAVLRGVELVKTKEQ